MNTYTLHLAVNVCAHGIIEIQAPSLTEAIEQVRDDATSSESHTIWGNVDEPDWASEHDHRIVGATCEATGENCIEVLLTDTGNPHQIASLPLVHARFKLALEPHPPIPAAHLTSLDELTALAERFCKSNNLEHQDVAEMLADPSRYTNDQLAWLSAFSDVWSEVEGTVAGGNI